MVKRDDDILNIITSDVIKRSIAVSDFSSLDYYGDGTLLGGILSRSIPIKLRDGTEIIPAFEAYDVRKKYRNSIEYYRSGKVKSIYLQEPVEIRTQLGLIRAELITFYEIGVIKKIYPLYGQISAYWSPEQESENAPEAAVTISGITHNLKIESITLYENGSIRSIDFWEKTKSKRSEKNEH